MAIGLFERFLDPGTPLLGDLVGDADMGGMLSALLVTSGVSTCHHGDVQCVVCSGDI